MKKLGTAGGAFSFPVGIFALYMFSYGGQAIYSTYLNLYFAGVGLTQPQIGMTVSVSTLFIVVSQVVWGVAGDRVKYKNTIISFMFFISAFTVLLFYASTAYWFILLAVIVFTCFHNGVDAILTSVVLEAAEGKRWNYGQICAGGTLGYCVTVLSIGFIIGEEYGRIFVLASVSMFVCFVLSTRLPRVKGHRKGVKEKTPYRVLLQSKPLLAIIAVNFIFSMGLNFFYNFYPVYFTSIGGSSVQIGVMMFFCAITEIPCLMIADRVVKRFGLDKVLIIAGLVTCVRWALLFALKTPVFVIAASMLHGPCYVGFFYGIVTFINRHVPKDLQAASQSFNILISKYLSQVVFGYLGGLASERLGTNYLMLAAGILLLLTTGAFALWSVRNHSDFVYAPLP